MTLPCIYTKKTAILTYLKLTINNYTNNQYQYWQVPAGIYLLKVMNRNTRTKCEICSKLKYRHQNDVDVVLVSCLFTLNIFHTLL